MTPSPELTFTVFGNAGELSVNATTGDVISYNPQEDGRYSDITRFDITEWRKYYPHQPIEDAWIDILDIGFWHSHGYEEPVEEFRKTLRGLVQSK